MPEQKCDYQGCEEPALEDSEYCIYHKPDKDEEEARKFYHRIRREAREPEGEVVESGQRKEYGEWVVEKKPKRWVFEEKLDWKGYRFPESASEEQEDLPIFTFARSIFNSEVNCSSAKFETKMFFKDALFEQDVNFEGSSRAQARQS